jgi:hypothetical protein
VVVRKKSRLIDNAKAGRTDRRPTARVNGGNVAKRVLRRLATRAKAGKASARVMVAVAGEAQVPPVLKRNDGRKASS